MNNKKIKFQPSLEIFQVVAESPTPASLHIPEWYKKLQTHIDGTKDHRESRGGSNLTMKMCVPVLDSLTAGYMITLPTDVAFTKEKNKYRVMWDVSWTPVSEHGPAQVGDLPVPLGMEKVPYKWEGTHIIKTPPGYSSLITHPFYRYDLPFNTLTAVVDTDNYNFLPINLPFFLKEEYEGVIKKGTPIAQVIPFKRENWESEVENFESKNMYSLDYLKTTIIRSYKTRFWSKKRYI